MTSFLLYVVFHLGWHYSHCFSVWMVHLHWDILPSRSQWHGKNHELQHPVNQRKMSAVLVPHVRWSRGQSDCLHEDRVNDDAIMEEEWNTGKQMETRRAEYCLKIQVPGELVFQCSMHSRRLCSQVLWPSLTYSNLSPRLVSVCGLVLNHSLKGRDKVISWPSPSQRKEPSIDSRQVEEISISSKSYRK